MAMFIYESKIISTQCEENSKDWNSCTAIRKQVIREASWRKGLSSAKENKDWTLEKVMWSDE